MGISLPLFVWDVPKTLFTIGPVEVRYYGLMWALGFIISAYIISNIMKREGYPEKTFDSFFWYTLLSTVIGSRLGHCLFYGSGYYLTHPIEILYIHQGGMASHGAAIGLLVGLWLFSRKNKIPYIWSLDRISILAAISGALVRIGNFMNSEIFGRPTTLPWGVEFVLSDKWNKLYKGLPCHPTQLYEALAYLIIFVVFLWLYYRKNLAQRRPGAMFGIFLIALFGIRFLIEFIKNPQEDFEVGMILNMGQLLSIPFIVAGCVLLYRVYHAPKKKLEKK